MTANTFQLGKRFESARSALADYRRIATRTHELGFPTTVRTLRFYVNEGLVAPPVRHGRTALFPEAETLELLLAIHVLQSCLRLSLQAIRELLQQHSAELELLTARCLELKELVSGRWQRVERNWLVGTFVSCLRGDATLYPRCRRGEPGLRGAGEIDLKEMSDDLRRLSSWQQNEAGKWVWISPEESLSRGAPNQCVDRF